ncbi:MAG TPA: Asp23/Gls24 family envelope stress response protein [Clostridia bacterium]|nr:Asp23/Gls24 family envelope stress response protein [Clostridia bacterium]
MEVNDLADESTQAGIDEYGKVTFADEVVATIAGLAALEVKGVSSMSAGIVEKFGKKSPTRGVKVEVGEREAAVDLFMVVDYGVQIPEVAWNVQENVKKSIETMTGLSVVEVNIYIQGIEFHKEISEQHSIKQ